MFIKSKNQTKLLYPKSWKQGFYFAINKSWNEFCRSTSFNGFFLIVTEKINSKGRLIWFLLLCFVTISSFLTSKIFYNKFQSTAVINYIQTKYASINASPFPGVTICQPKKMFIHKINNFIDEM